MSQCTVSKNEEKNNDHTASQFRPHFKIRNWANLQMAHSTNGPPWNCTSNWSYNHMNETYALFPYSSSYHGNTTTKLLSFFSQIYTHLNKMVPQRTKFRCTMAKFNNVANNRIESRYQQGIQHHQINICNT